MLHIEIPPEVRQYQEKLIGGLTARQIIAAALALLVCVPLFWFGRKVIPDDVLGWIIILIALPIGGIGFFKFNGMTMEKILKIFFLFEVLFPQKRKFKTDNAFRFWQGEAQKADRASGLWQTMKYDTYRQKISLEKAFLMEAALSEENYGYDVSAETLLAAENPLGRSRKLSREQNAEKKRRKKAIFDRKNKEGINKLNNQMKKRREARTVIAGEISKRIPFTAEFGDGLFEVTQGRYSKMYRVTDIPYGAYSAEEKGDFLNRYMGFYAGFPKDVRVSFTIDSDFDDGKKRLFFTLSLEAATPIEALVRFRFLDKKFSESAKALGCEATAVDSAERVVYYHGKFRKGRLDELVDRETNVLRFDLDTIRKSGMSTKDFIAPQILHFKNTEFLCGERWARVLYLNNLPRAIGDTFLTDLADSGFPIVVTLNTEKVDVDSVSRVVEKRVKKLDGDEMTGMEKRAARLGYNAESIQHNIRFAAGQAKEYVGEVKDCGQDMTLVSVLFFVGGESVAELDKNCKTLSDKARMYLCSLQTLSMQQDEGMKSVLPFGYVSKTLFVERSLTSGLLVAFVPFFGDEFVQVSS